tara:strand:- start:703 stop:1494 length:792 start_codon:yes stop_codon:yes gene_type:complete
MAADIPGLATMDRLEKRIETTECGHSKFGYRTTGEPDAEDLHLALSKACSDLLKVLRAEHERLPFHDIFLGKKNQNVGVAVMDPFRAQLVYEEIPTTHSARALMAYILDLLHDVLDKTYDIARQNMVIGDVVILRSYPYGNHQETHLDMNVHQWGQEFNKSPLFGLLALQDNTSLCLNVDATEHFREHATTTGYDVPLYKARILELRINQGEGLLMKAECAHFGPGYKRLNFRIHFSLTPEIIDEYELDPDTVHTSEVVFFPN